MGTRESLIGGWQQELTGTVLLHCIEVIEKFDLAHIYNGNSPLPLARRGSTVIIGPAG
jgi:hypothetical protein